MTCIILAFDRFFEMCFPKVAKRIFGGRMIYIWLAFPVIYIFYSFFEVPLVYNVVDHAFFFDPYYGSPGFASSKVLSKKLLLNSKFQFLSTFHTVHNMIVISCIGGVYTVLCITLTVRYKVYKSQTISKFQLLVSC